MLHSYASANTANSLQVSCYRSVEMNEQEFVFNLPITKSVIMYISIAQPPQEPNEIQKSFSGSDMFYSKT